MNIIPHILKNELKKRLESKFINFTEEVIEASVSCLLNPNDKIKYVTILSKVESKMKSLICETLAEIFNALDELYIDTANRKLFYNINKRNEERTITTFFGDICFKRTYYKSKLDGSLHYLLDEMLNLPKKDIYDPSVKARAIDVYSKTNMSKAGQIVGAELTDMANLGNDAAIKTIPRQTIQNWAKDWKTPTIKYAQRKTPKILYVMGDEKFIGCQDQENDIMVKSFVVFEGVETVSKGRRKLKNRTVINMISKKPWEEFSDILFQMYDSREVEKIYLIGDGANWIKSGLAELKVEPDMDVKHLLCEFHYKQAIHHITTDKEEREILLLSFASDTKKQFEAYVDEVMDANPKRKETIEKKKKYILNNYKAIKDMLESNIGSSMESHISHCVADMFGSRPKGYSTQNIKKYLDINNFHNNGFNIFNLYVQTYFNEESVALNEKEINYSMFETKKRSNVTVLENGENTVLYKALSHIAHGYSSI